MNGLKAGKISEYIARVLVLTALLAVPVLAGVAQRRDAAQAGVHSVEIHARMPENGGWLPDKISIPVGEQLRLRLVSDDVVHGFAIGQSDLPEIDILPGETVETTLVFDRPGKYTFYCTRWCGENHWRMRGTIEVTGPSGESTPPGPPLFETLGIDIDAPHPAAVVPENGSRPSAAQGAALDVEIPEGYQSRAYYEAASPAQAWQSLRSEPSLQGLSDADLWNLVAYLWQANSTPQAFERGQQLYSQNCAACHGEKGAGDGVLAIKNLQPHTLKFNDLHSLESPADFTDASQMLGASPALLQGKILRGGMGTGMPYWGPIFTEEDTWALAAYLWSFQFELERLP